MDSRILSNILRRLKASLKKLPKAQTAEINEVYDRISPAAISRDATATRPPVDPVTWAIQQVMDN